LRSSAIPEDGRLLAATVCGAGMTPLRSSAAPERDRQRDE